MSFEPRFIHHEVIVPANREIARQEGYGWPVWLVPTSWGPTGLDERRSMIMTSAAHPTEPVGRVLAELRRQNEIDIQAMAEREGVWR